MKIKTLMVIVALPLVALASPAQAQRAGDKIPGSYICVFNKDVSRANAQAEASRAAQVAQTKPRHVYSAAMRGFALNASPEAIENMRRLNAKIAYCEQDQVVALIPFRTGAPAGGVTAAAQETPWGIARVNGGRPGNFATAWVIDTGIQLNHPELNVDTTRSRSFVGRSANDRNGHGTHVAGTIAARDNGTGVIGVAPGALLVAVQVLESTGSGSTSGVIAGIDYVAANGRPGDVANMSLGGVVSSAMDTAVLNATAGGVRFVIAAGNSSANAANSSPARVNGPNIFTVSAFGIGDVFASFSNFGNPPVDFSEPGVNVKSTWLRSGFNTISGTSMAAPHLAGILLQGSAVDGGRVTGDRDTTPDVIGVLP